MIAYQPELSPALPVVVGNFDYHQYRSTLERIDELLRVTGTEKSFIRYYLAEAERLADSPLLQWFCGINRLDVIKVPSKSSIERYDKAVSESVLRDVVNQLTLAAVDVNDQGLSIVGLETPLSLSTLLLDTTCVKANIHFPVDWVLLRDAARTLLKSRRFDRQTRAEKPHGFTYGFYQVG